jgi:LacI family transcriptional regulator
MEALGYVYNRRAAEMRSLTSRILGLVVANVRNPYFAELTMAVEEAAGASGYTVLLGCSSDDVDRQSEVLRAMAEHQVDGVILLPASHTTPAELEELLRRPRMPHALVSRAVQGYACDYVGADNEASGELAGRHLGEIGVRTVALLGGVERSLPREDRRRGLLTGLAPHGGSLVADVPSAYDTNEDPAPMLERALAAGVPDAIVTYNDMYAFAVLGALRARGLEPGRQVAVASFDDVPGAESSYPSLTSAAGFPAQVGATATEIVLAAIDQPATELRQVLVAPALNARQSTLTWHADGATLSA